jgi:large subunit ribosomal protein L35
MPKIKSHKGIAKRVKKTGNGKLKRHSAYHSHLLSSKTAKRKRNLRKSSSIDKTYLKRYKKLIPYE